MSNKPSTAYDYRRYILLVQALAEFAVESELRTALIKLAKDWQVPLRDDAPYSWLETIPTIQIVQMLSQFIVRYRPNSEPMRSQFADDFAWFRAHQQWEQLQDDLIRNGK